MRFLAQKTRFRKDATFEKVEGIYDFGLKNVSLHNDYFRN
jgi:hypothetical protein